MAELKPCPFCGGEARLEHDYCANGHSYVHCKKCGLTSIKFMRSFDCSSDANAIEYWNTRANEKGGAE